MPAYQKYDVPTRFAEEGGCIMEIELAVHQFCAKNASLGYEGEPFEFN